MQINHDPEGQIQADTLDTQCLACGNTLLLTKLRNESPEIRTAAVDRETECFSGTSLNLPLGTEMLLFSERLKESGRQASPVDS